MGSVKEYFQSLGSGIASLIKGLQVTGKELVTPKITEFYPEDRETRHVPERFRAILQLVYDKDGRHKCIACGTCERVCPNGTITLETKMVETADGKKKKKLDKYLYDLGSCTFCQLCVQNCPTDALAFNNDFEQAVFTREKLLKKLNYLPEVEDPAPSPEELAKAKAEKEAKIAAALKAKAEREAAAAGQAPEAGPAAQDPVQAKAIAAFKAKCERDAAKLAEEGKTEEEIKTILAQREATFMAALKAKAERDAAKG